MKAAMLKPAGEPNVILDTSVLPKLTGGPGTKRLAGEAGRDAWGCREQRYTATQTLYLSSRLPTCRACPYQLPGPVSPQAWCTR